MFRIKTLNKISATGLAHLNPGRFTVATDMEKENGILVRSADMHEYAFPDTLRAIARAGAGTNNIPIDRCTEAGVVVFNTPGANANAVKELVVCALMLASRNVVGGVEWVKAQAAEGADVAKVVEKGKSQFVGPEIQGKSLGVIGLGAIGVYVANIATQLGMTVYGYDPFLSVHGALALSPAVQHCTDLATLYKNCDYITIHVPQTAETRGMIDALAIAQMRPGVRVINLARGGLVVNCDMADALAAGKVACYVTDFPDSEITLVPGVVPIPHLGASSPESEENCAVMAAQQLRDYLEAGNIRNSVNLPDLEQPWSGETRICIIHKNIPNMLASITALLSKDSVNVANLTNKSKGEYAYTVVDVDARVGDVVADELRAIDGILRVRVINH